MHCDRCDAFEVHRDWIDGKCNGVVHQAKPILNEALSLTIHCLMTNIVRSRLMNEPPNVIGLVIPRANLVDGYCLEQGLNDANRVTFCSSFSRLLFGGVAEHLVYANRGTNKTGNFGVCLVNGDQVYFTDTRFDRDDIVVKVGDEIFNVIEATRHEGIVIGVLDRFAGIPHYNEPYQAPIFVSAPSCVPIVSHARPLEYPSIEFRGGVAVALNVGDSTFINESGHHYQIFSSIVEHPIKVMPPIVPKLSNYAIEFPRDVGVELTSRFDVEKAFYAQFRHQCTTKAALISNSMLLIETAAPIDELKDVTKWRSLLDRLSITSEHQLRVVRVTEFNGSMLYRIKIEPHISNRSTLLWRHFNDDIQKLHSSFSSIFRQKCEAISVDQKTHTMQIQSNCSLDILRNTSLWTSWLKLIG